MKLAHRRERKAERVLHAATDSAFFRIDVPRSSSSATSFTSGPAADSTLNIQISATLCAADTVFGAAEYPRLELAIALDEAAALESASWGIGQVMGFNHEAAGFDTPRAMVDAMLLNEDAQLLAMANFIMASNLARALQNQDWTAFARGYNGQAFAENKYDEKRRDAHQKYQAALPNLAMRTAQAALLYVGLEPGPVDGVSGKRTRAALATFQERNGLPQTGELDEATEDRLLADAFPADVPGGGQ